MEIPELMGIGVGIVSAVLGGVWFIVHKAFGVGRFSHHIDEVDRRTVHAACELHGRDIDSIKTDLKSIKNDVLAIKSLLTMKHKDAAAGAGGDGRE